MNCKRDLVRAVVTSVLLWGAGCSKEQATPPTAGAQTSLAAQTADEPAVVSTNRVEGEAFLVEWKAGAGAAGGKTQGQLVLTPKAPFKCNLEYPYKLKVSAQSVALTQAEITKPAITVDTKQVVIPVEYTMPTAPELIDGHLAFSVCTDDKCLIERTQLKMTTQAQ